MPNRETVRQSIQSAGRSVGRLLSFSRVIRRREAAGPAPTGDRCVLNGGGARRGRPTGAAPRGSDGLVDSGGGSGGGWPRRSVPAAPRLAFSERLPEAGAPVRKPCASELGNCDAGRAV